MKVQTAHMKKNIFIGLNIGLISEEFILFQNVLTFLSYYKVSRQCINILDILQSYYCSLSRQFGGKIVLFQVRELLR